MLCPFTPTEVLEVHESDKKDFGNNVARISKKSMENIFSDMPPGIRRLGICNPNDEDYKFTYTDVRFSESDEENMIRLDGTTRRNLAVSIGEKVEVGWGFGVHNLGYILIKPIGNEKVAKLSSNLSPKYLADLVMKQYVGEGEVFLARNLMGNFPHVKGPKHFAYEVISCEPYSEGMITQSTHIEILGKGIEDYVSNNLFKLLEKSGRKFKSQKEESVKEITAYVSSKLER